MASPLLVKATFLVVMCIVLCTPLADGALPCLKVELLVAPCLGYLIGPGEAVPAPCCNGVRTVNNTAMTTPDRQDACTCIKSIVKNIHRLNLAKLADLPGKCGVNLPFKISPSLDCNTVKGN